MKVVVDLELCEANAKCMEACPEVFYVDDDDVLHLKQETFDEALLGKVKEAVRLCPRQAISIAED